MNSTTVALEFLPAVQKECSDAPNSKFLIGFGLSSLLRVNLFEIGPTTEEIYNSFVMSGILAKQAHEFGDEFGRCVSQKHFFT